MALLLHNTLHYNRHFKGDDIMTTRKQSAYSQYSLQHLEDISRKLVSPFGAALTREEIVMLNQLRHKEGNMPNLRSLDQFFANNLVVR